MKIRGEKGHLCILLACCIIFIVINSSYSVSSSRQVITGQNRDLSHEIFSPITQFNSSNNNKIISLNELKLTNFILASSLSSSISWINVTPSSQIVSNREHFTIDIHVVPAESIAGIQMEFLFDPNLVFVDSIIEGDLFHEYTTYFHPGKIDNFNGSIKGVFNVILTPGAGVLTPGIFVTLSLSSKNINGTSSLNLSNVVMGNPSALQVPAIVNNGTVTISVKDSQIPEISDISVYAIQQSNIVNITCKATDNQGIKMVNVYIITPSNGHINLSLNRYLNSDIYYLNHTYQSFGAYYFSIWAEDLFGNTQSSPFLIIFRFRLSSGWNLITLPIQNNYTAYSLSQAIGHTCDSIVRWDSQNQTYHSHPSGTLISDFSIVQGLGYFIHVWDTTFFTLSGKPLMAKPVLLMKGYNLIGWYSKTNITTGDLLDSITGCDIVSMWDSITHTYRNYLINQGVNLLYINTGDGVFVHLTQGTIWPGGK